jgi:hypothetical protein
MSTFHSVLGQWFTEILSNVDKSEQTKQRHKKVMIDRSNKSVHNQLITDVTFTYHQNVYQNVNPESIIKQVIGDKNGSGITKYCVTDRNRPLLMLKARQKLFFKPRDVTDGTSYDDMIRQFNDSFFSKAKFRSFLDELQKNKKWKQWSRVYTTGDDIKRLETEQFDFLRKLYIPDYLWEFLRGKDRDHTWKLIMLIRDSELQLELESSLPNTPEARKAMDQFLNNRVGSVGAELTAELQIELQNYFPGMKLDTLGNLDKCTLTLFYNIKKALSMLKQTPHQHPANIKKLKIIKGINRLHMPPDYEALVRPERAKVAARRAIHMYTSGLRMITKGLNKKNFSYIMRGYAMIYNIRSRRYEKGKQSSGLKGSCPVFSKQPNWQQVADFPCDEFRDKESAASAVLLMYMEMMDYFVSPSPPLMLRNQMQVTAVYVDPVTKLIEDFNVETYQEWSSHKETAFKKEYNKFLLKYMNVGFTVTDKIGPHGLPLLNLDSWGTGAVVANPFRVREDTFLFKYFGGFRLEFNRLGIGAQARLLWLKHTIKHSYDPNYADAFIAVDDPPNGKYTHDSDFPRPIFDVQYYNPKTLELNEMNSDAYSNLYFNVSSVRGQPNGPQQASHRREKLNKYSLQEWAQLDFKDLYNLDNSTFNPPGVEPEKSNMSRESSVLLNIHTHFRKNALQMPFMNDDGRGFDMDMNLMINVYPKWQLFEPIPGTGLQGSRPHQKGFQNWRGAKHNTIFDRDPSTSYTVDEHQVTIGREFVSPPPPLFNRFLHPITHTEVPMMHLKKTDRDDCEDYEVFWESGLHIEELFKHKCIHTPEWMYDTFNDGQNQIQSFVYPLETITGLLEPGVTVYPIGEASVTGGEFVPPYNHVSTSMFVLTPKQPQFWDLRNSLVEFLKGKKLFSLLRDANNAMQKAEKWISEENLNLQNTQNQLYHARPDKDPLLLNFDNSRTSKAFVISTDKFKMPASQFAQVIGTGQPSSITTWFYTSGANQTITQSLGAMSDDPGSDVDDPDANSDVDDPDSDVDDPDSDVDKNIHLSKHISIPNLSCRVQKYKLASIGNDEDVLYIRGTTYHDYQQSTPSLGCIITSVETDAELDEAHKANNIMFNNIRKKCSQKGHILGIGEQSHVFALGIIPMDSNKDAKMWLKLQISILEQLITLNKSVNSFKFDFLIKPSVATTKPLTVKKALMYYRKKLEKLNTQERSIEWVNSHYTLPDGFKIKAYGGAGFGIVAIRNHKFYKKDQNKNRIGFYSGEKMSEVDHSAKYPGETPSKYSITVGKNKVVIDASGEDPENWARFINDPHGRKFANAEFTEVGKDKVCVELLKDIKAGEQLLVNYNADDADDKHTHAFADGKVRLGR